jgi:flagellar hook-associated protein 3
MLPNVDYDMQQTQQALSTALQQVSTGQRVNAPSDDPAAAADSVRLGAESADVDQYTTNVSTLQSQLQSADSAISAVVSSLNSAIAIGTAGANGIESGADRQIAASQVGGLLTTIISAGNASFQGAYLFGGSASASSPFVAASTTYVSGNGTAANPLSAATALTTGSVTAISDASTGQTMTFTAAAGDTVGTLQAAIASAVSAGTLSSGTTATINSSGQLQIATNNSSSGIVVNTNDAVLGNMSAASGTSVANAYAYVGNNTVNKVRVGDSLTVAANLPGSQLLTGNSSVLGAMNQLITALQNGTTQQIGDAVTAVSTALNSVDAQRVPLDNTISQLNDQESYLSQEQVTLTSQQTSLTGINEAEAATNLSQAELASNTVLAAAAKVVPETLLNYLQ